MYIAFITENVMKHEEINRKILHSFLKPCTRPNPSIICIEMSSLVLRQTFFAFNAIEHS